MIVFLKNEIIPRFIILKWPLHLARLKGTPEIKTSTVTGILHYKQDKSTWMNGWKKIVGYSEYFSEWKKEVIDKFSPILICVLHSRQFREGMVIKIEMFPYKSYSIVPYFFYWYCAFLWKRSQEWRKHFLTVINPWDWA